VYARLTTKNARQKNGGAHRSIAMAALRILIATALLCAGFSGVIRMSDRTAKKSRRYLRDTYKDKVNGAATLALRREIFRLARNRDILGAVVIAETIALIIMGVILWV
jgi:hypothetical protein